LGRGGAAYRGNTSLHHSSITATFQTLNTGTASAAYQLNSNGTANESINGGAYSLLENWCIPSAQAVNYECYATPVIGTVDGASAATGTWLALSTTRFWRATQSSPGGNLVVINVGIRRVGTTTILASADIELSAEYI
jgi:hypothetical protein